METEQMEETGTVLQEWSPLEVGSTVYLSTDDINVDHDANSRRYAAGKIVEMRDSLIAHGQLQPVKITSTTRRLALGYRRTAGIMAVNAAIADGLKISRGYPLAANLLSGQVLIRCEVIAELSERDLYLMNMAENDDREDTTPIDRAYQMQRLTSPVDSGGFGMTQKECAIEMSRSKVVTQSTISKFLKVLAEAPAWAIKLVHEGKRHMENLIAVVGHPAGSAERDTALAAFKEGDSAAKTASRVRETAGDDSEDTSAVEEGTPKKKKPVRSRAELVAAFEEWAFVEQNAVATPFEEVFQMLGKFAAGKMSAKKLETEVALRVKKTLPKAEAA